MAWDRVQGPGGESLDALRASGACAGSPYLAGALFGIFCFGCSNGSGPGKNFSHCW